MTCAILPSVKRYVDHDDPRLTAHQEPMALALDAIIGCAHTAGEMQQAIANHEPQEEVLRHREIAKAKFEAYLDLMAEIAHHAGKLKP